MCPIQSWHRAELFRQFRWMVIIDHQAWGEDLKGCFESVAVDLTLLDLPVYLPVAECEAAEEWPTLLDEWMFLHSHTYSITIFKVVASDYFHWVRKASIFPGHNDASVALLRMSLWLGCWDICSEKTRASTSLVRGEKCHEVWALLSLADAKRRQVSISCPLAVFSASVIQTTSPFSVPFFDDYK